MKNEETKEIISAQEEETYKGLSGKLIFIKKKISIYDVWDYFNCYLFEHFDTKLNEEIQFKKCKCEVQDCLKQNKWIVYCKNTTNMIKHLQVHHSEIFKKVEEAAIKKEKDNQTLKTCNQKLKQNNLNNFIIKKNDSKNILFEIIMMNILDNQPNNIVENQGFLRLLKLINEQYQPPCRKMLKNYVDQVYSILIDHIKKRIEKEDIQQNGFSLIWDHWRPKYLNKDFLSVIFKYINNQYELKTIYLKVFQIDDKTSDGIINDLQSCQDFYNLLNDNQQQSLLKRFAMSDKASANVSAILNCEFLYTEHHLYCFSHTFDNSVLNGIKESQVNNLLNKINENCSWFKDKASQRHQKLEEMYNSLQQQKENQVIFTKIKITNNTRWWTYNIMINSFLKNYDAIKIFYNQCNQDLIKNEINMSEIETIQYILHLFQNLQKIFNSLQLNNEVTINKLLPNILKIQENILQKSENENYLITDLKVNLLSQFTKRIDNNYKNSFILLQVASYLDPNFRDFSKMKYSTQIFQIHNFVVELVINQQSKIADELNNQNQIKSKEDESSLMKFIEQQIENQTIKDDKNQIQTTKQKIMNELEFYNQYQFKLIYQNPLSYYQDFSNKFPILSQIIKSIYSLPSTSKQTEYHFSQMKNQITSLVWKKICFNN